jgi:restriction endonuclease Mrr
MKCASESWRHTRMPVPTYDQFIEPILRYLADRPDGAAARDVYEAAASALGLDTAQRQEMLPSGSQTVYKRTDLGEDPSHDRPHSLGLPDRTAGPAPRLLRGKRFSRRHATTVPARAARRVQTSQIAKERRSIRPRFIAITTPRGVVESARRGSRRPSSRGGGAPSTCLGAALWPRRSSPPRRRRTAAR